MHTTNKNNKKKNTSNQDVKKQLTHEIVEKMNCIDLDAQKFQRIARDFFKTSYRSNSVWLQNQATKTSCVINFDYDKPNNYISMKYAIWNKGLRSYSYIEIWCKKPKYNRDLFIILLRYKIIT